MSADEPNRTDEDGRGNGEASGTRSGGRETLSSLGRRIDQARAREQALRGHSRPTASGAALGFAFRIASELAAGVGLGVLVGWWLDAWLGTRPWLLIVCLLLGVVGGMWNVLRTAERMQRLGTGAPGEGSSSSDHRDRKG